ncbi:lipopolysaccharide-induced tumor necrosis factor-alpha factor homolog [Asterias rubens]|uniref:lipopolysaccharide-induced tumor necrosis factor-alpha factor homolog n=1 Tax=Asterias rubens TaxID=7604 RepID=UPI001455531E|nr:lipopolysaccharide-induced tumor necrosis factor-alpha factor homolog [Asterias rubens]
MQMVCPQCQQSVMTRTAYINGLLLWLVVGSICLFGGFLGCCLIPFCISGCKDVAHSCPQCNAYLGTFKRM